MRERKATSNKREWFIFSIKKVNGRKPKLPASDTKDDVVILEYQRFRQEIALIAEIQNRHDKHSKSPTINA